MELHKMKVYAPVIVRHKMGVVVIADVMINKKIIAAIIAVTKFLEVNDTNKEKVRWNEDSVGWIKNNKQWK